MSFVLVEGLTSVKISEQQIRDFSAPCRFVAPRQGVEVGRRGGRIVTHSRRAGPPLITSMARRSNSYS
jgi:hypothetical protein